LIGILHYFFSKNIRLSTFQISLEFVPFISFNQPNLQFSKLEKKKKHPLHIKNIAV